MIDKKMLKREMCGIDSFEVPTQFSNSSCEMKSTTDLASLIGNTQCENFRIFLPLIFYVKSILVILKLHKL